MIEATWHTRTYGNSMFNLLRNFQIFFLAASFYISTSGVQKFRFLRIFANTVIVIIIFKSPPSGSEIVSHGDFSSVFLMANNVERIFFMFAGHLYIVFGEMYSPFAHFLIGLLVFLLLSCKRSLYILASPSWNI